MLQQKNFEILIWERKFAKNTVLSLYDIVSSPLHSKKNDNIWALDRRMFKISCSLSEKSRIIRTYKSFYLLFLIFQIAIG